MGNFFFGGIWHAFKKAPKKKNPLVGGPQKPPLCPKSPALGGEKKGAGRPSAGALAKKLSLQKRGARVTPHKRGGKKRLFFRGGEIFLGAGGKPLGGADSGSPPSPPNESNYLTDQSDPLPPPRLSPEKEKPAPTLIIPT